MGAQHSALLPPSPTVPVSDALVLRSARPGFNNFPVQWMTEALGIKSSTELGKGGEVMCERRSVSEQSPKAIGPQGDGERELCREIFELKKCKI